MADIFDVIADGTRRDILRLLLEHGSIEDSGTSVSQLVHELGVSQPTVSKHLKVLREAGLVVVREDGQHRFYRVVATPLDAVEDWLLPFFEADDEAYATVPLPETAVNAATVVGRAAASAKHALDTALRRLPAR